MLIEAIFYFAVICLVLRVEEWLKRFGSLGRQGWFESFVSCYLLRSFSVSMESTKPVMGFIDS
jgi:hypothetical protein